MSGRTAGTGSAPNVTPPAQGPPPAQAGRSSLATTGVPLPPAMLFLGAVLVIVGAAVLYAYRRRRSHRS
ncbi:hypothetical protein [Amycolatopsis azurea]|uniref:Uncharacterized protein n=1 Tax=Amycolatopsis azurea DSM 43854 TaxID=1238180 RepID=M2QIM0_9PSEU|nr:hypothetical protein [Amycolatopsis azurea]EMD26546.1 hypothetical protein C791_3390 [Amycolatopsis azurea DSM 43854]